MAPSRGPSGAEPPTPSREEARPVEIRLAGAADVAAIVELVQSAYRGDESRAGWTTEADLLEGQRTDLAAVAALVTGGSSGRSSVLLAAHPFAAGPVGCCEVEPAGERRAYFGMFAVRPALQGRGVGRRLLEAAEEHARLRLGAGVMSMQVLRQRQELIAWYRRMGYQPTGETAPFPYGDERFGRPRRADLEFVVLERRIAGAAPG